MSATPLGTRLLVHPLLGFTAIFCFRQRTNRTVSVQMDTDLPSRMATQRSQIRITLTSQDTVMDLNVAIVEGGEVIRKRNLKGSQQESDT